MHGWQAYRIAEWGSEVEKFGENIFWVSLSDLFFCLLNTDHSQNPAVLPPLPLEQRPWNERRYLTILRRGPMK